jgi:hypothetical protein
MFDITAIGNELAKHQTVDGPARILFDWSQIRSWPFGPPSAASIRTWNLSAPAIALGAFVHDRKWNRHVALLAALLRVGNAEVRSFQASDFESATRLARARARAQVVFRANAPLVVGRVQIVGGRSSSAWLAQSYAGSAAALPKTRCYK